MNHLPSGIRTLVRGIRLVMRTYCAVSIYTYMLSRGKETAAVAVNNLLQSLSLSRGCFVFLRYRRTRIGIRPPAAAGVQGNGREGKGKGEFRR